jgi:hypothetical protein
MVARYAAPLCYNFLYLIRLRTPDGKPSLTVFETVYLLPSPIHCHDLALTGFLVL